MRRVDFQGIPGSISTGCLLLVLLGAVTAYGQVDMTQPQVWDTTQYWQAVQFGDFYGPNYKAKDMKPISMVGARNGTFSGYVVVTHGMGAITELKGVASDLVSKDGKKIEAAKQIRVRYPLKGTPRAGRIPAHRFDGLADEPPEEVEIVNVKADGRGFKPKNSGPVAMQPIWITVKVPKNAAAGNYEGTLTISAEDMKPSVVKVTLRVYDWIVPDPTDFKVQNPANYSPHSVAMQYELEKWSDEHFEMMGKSLALMKELGSRQISIPLVTRYPAQDNPEGMVRWVKQKDGTYKHDFTIVDKYLETAAKAIGKPFPIRIMMWCAIKAHLPGRSVTVYDPEKDEISELAQPTQGTPENEKFWKPVLDELKKKLDARGWYGNTVVNWINYCGAPEAPIVNNLHNIWPDAKWASTDHGRRTSFSYGENKSMPVIASTAVWQEGDLKAYEVWDKKTSPGPRPFGHEFKPGYAVGAHARNQHREWFSLWIYRLLCEQVMMKGNYGVDPLGADLWPIPTPRGWRGMEWSQYALGPRNSTQTMIAPGKEGPVATERFEAFREGVQLCEAMIYCYFGVKSGKLTPEVAKLANDALDDRARLYFASRKIIDKKGGTALDDVAYAAKAQELEGKTFAAAAAVQKALGK